MKQELAPESRSAKACTGGVLLVLTVTGATNCWESESACAEEGSHNVLFLEEILRMGDVKQHNIHAYRERERHTHTHKELYLLLTKGATVTNEQQP